MKRIVSYLVPSLVLFAGIPAFAGPAPCPTPPSISVILLGGGAASPNNSYCVSDYGWVNGWFTTATPPIPYDPATSQNLLADNAQYILYTFVGGGGDSSWLTPALSSGLVSSNFSVVTPVTPSGADAAESVITDGSITIMIDSTIIQGMLDQTYTIQNISGQTISSIDFSDYFHYFPGTIQNPTVGTLSYAEVESIVGTPAKGLFGNGPTPGSTCGGPELDCSDPQAYEVGAPGTVQGDIAANSLNSGITSVPMDAAGALQWTTPALFSLAPGQSTTFNTELVPEPSTLALLLLAGAGLWLRRRSSTR